MDLPTAGGVTQVASGANTRAVLFTIHQMKVWVTGTNRDIYKANEFYAESLIRQGALPQISNPDHIIAGNVLGGPQGSGKDLWVFKNRQPISVELKYTDKGEVDKLSMRRTDLHGRISQDPRLHTMQISARGDRNDWLTWLRQNRKEAEALVKKGLLDSNWLNEDWIKENGAGHFRKQDNRYIVVVSKDGRAGLNERLRTEIGLPSNQVIRLATPK